MSHVVQGNADSADPKNDSMSLLVILAILLLALLSYLSAVANISFLALVCIQLHTVAGAACLATTVVSNIPIPLFFVPLHRKELEVEQHPNSSVS